VIRPKTWRGGSERSGQVRVTPIRKGMAGSTELTKKMTANTVSVVPPVANSGTKKSTGTIM
jgi:hypothetical protein